MYTGFRLATKAGISIGVNDMVVPESKAEILSVAETEVKEIRTSTRPVSSPTVSATTRSSISGRAPMIRSPRR